MQSTTIILIVQNEGINFIEKLAKEQSEEYILNILKKATDRINLSSITYLSWNEATKDEIDAIEDISLKIEKEDYSYSLYVESPHLKKPFYTHNANYFGKYVFVPSAKGAKTVSEDSRLLNNYLNYADNRNSKEIEYE